MNADTLARELADRFHLSRRTRSWAGDCPACGYSRAFSIRVGKGARPSLFCANGCSRETLDDEAGRAMGRDWTPRAPRDTSAEQATREWKQAAALRLFAGSAPCGSVDPAGRYLADRGLAHLVGCEALRFRPDCPHPETRPLPAMVAAVSDASGRLVGVHRTYLTPDGHKASADPVKASLGPIWGGAIRLAPVGPELVIGEGIETAASAGLLLGLPAWAAISAGNMAMGLVLPPEVCSVIVAVDPDQPGLAAARAACARWGAEGRQVRTATPNTPGKDFNDLLLTGIPAGAQSNG